MKEWLFWLIGMVTSVARYFLMMTMIWVGYPFRNCLCILQETVRLLVIVPYNHIHNPLYCKCCIKTSWRSNPYIYTTFLHPWEWTSYILRTSREVIGMHLEYDATEITTHTCHNNNLFFVVLTYIVRSSEFTLPQRWITIHVCRQGIIACNNNNMLNPTT